MQKAEGVLSVLLPRTGIRAMRILHCAPCLCYRTIVVTNISLISDLRYGQFSGLKIINRLAFFRENMSRLFLPNFFLENIANKRLETKDMLSKTANRQQFLKILEPVNRKKERYLQRRNSFCRLLPSVFKLFVARLNRKALD